MGAADFDLAFRNDRMPDGVLPRVVADVNELPGRNRIEHAATIAERVRFARELHDGVLQSLTGAVLQLEVISRLVDEDPQAARILLREIQESIREEQRELRTWIETMRAATSVSNVSHAELAAALDKLCRRVTRWGPRVELTGPGSGEMPRSLCEQVCRLVEEALSNVTRHAHAQVVRVAVEILHDGVRIVVADDGCGFPFRGQYDLASLNARRQGPVSLKERVASLDGTLMLTSTLSGSRIAIDLPLQAHARASDPWRETDPAPRKPRFTRCCHRDANRPCR